MALPLNEWCSILNGPNMWRLAESLFRPDNELRRCSFTVSDPGLGPVPVEVRIVSVARQGSDYKLKGWVDKIGDETFLPALTFRTSFYDPDRRSGDLKLTSSVGQLV